MRTDLSTQLNDEQESLFRKPKGEATVESWLPNWVEEQAALSSGYFHAHDAFTNSDGKIWRARISLLGDLETAIYSATSGWEAGFSSAGFTGIFISPKWVSNTANNYGADIAIVQSGINARVFGVLTNGDVISIVLDSVGAYVSHEVVVSLGVPTNSVQLACSNDQTVYVLQDDLVEASNDAWQDDIYGSRIRRFTFGLGWEEDTYPFLFHTHSKGTLDTDNGISPSSTEAIAQWGFRHNGGMASFDLGSYDLVIFASKYYWQKSYVSGTLGLCGYLYNKENGVWTFAWQHDQAEFQDDYGLWLVGFVKGFSVGSQNFISWVRINEPSDFEQQSGNLAYQRNEETVVAKISSDGWHVSNPMYLGNDSAYCRAVVLRTTINNDLYCFGYEAVQVSLPASYFYPVSSSDKLDLELYSNKFSVSQNSNWNMGLTSPMVNADAIFNTFMKQGNIVRLYHGIQGDLEQIAVGYIEALRPTRSLDNANNSATVNIKAELQLLNTKNESIEDWLPLQTYSMKPVDDGLTVDNNLINGREVTIRHPSTITRKRDAGWFLMAKPRWQSLWFSGLYETVDLVYRNEAYPQALTGGGVNVAPGVVGGPGSVAETNKTGTMFSDLFWMRMEPKVDAAIQAAFRMGDNKNANNFGFTTANGTFTSLDVQRSNGLITNILYKDSEGNTWNDVAQESTACGLVFRSVQDPADESGAGKKYIFMWEANSNLEQGSHLEDQAGQWWGYGGVFDQPDYGGLPVGRNKLYLIMSDFDETDPDWKSNNKYLNKALLQIDATGLTVGHPAELKLQVLGGRVYCFYRAYQSLSSSPNLWRKAFDYNTGHFGAGLVGCVLRGQNTILWDAFEPASDEMRRFNNDVDVWDVEATDCSYDLSIKELIERYSHGGHTQAAFRTLETLNLSLLADSEQSFSVEAYNFSLDVKITINGAGEAGIYFRATDTGSYKQNGMFVGIRADATYQGAGNVVNCYAVLKQWEGGVETVVERQYSPSPIHIETGLQYKVRFSVREDLIIVYLEGNYIGHFHNEFAGGKTIGVTGTVNADFYADFIELNEVPENALVNPSQTMMEAINSVVGNRTVKGVFRWDGTVLVSYFDTHDIGPVIEDLILGSSLILSDRFVNMVEVQGAEGYFIYVYEPTLDQGRRFKLINQANILSVEDCEKEAKRVVRESMERIKQLTINMPMDIRIEPEDEATITVNAQGIESDKYYITDITKRFSFPDGDSSQVLSLRQRYDLI